MNLDEFNLQHVESLDLAIANSDLLSSCRLEDARPDELIAYVAGRLAAAEANDAHHATTYDSRMPVDMDPLFEVDHDNLESEVTFWRGVFETRGSLIWKRDTSKGRRPDSATSPRYPYFTLTGSRRLLLSFWGFILHWSAYPHLAKRTLEQIEEGRARVVFFGVDALFATRCLYSPDSFGLFANQAKDVLSWQPLKASDRDHVTNEDSMFGIKRRDVRRLRAERRAT